MRLPLAFAAALLLAACASEADLVDDERPAEAIYAEAESLLAEGRPVEAAERYDDVERLYPYSSLAKDAILRSARANFEARRFEEARLAAERFLTFYPSDPRAAEAQHLIAMTHYVRITDVGRDQGETREALAALRETVNRYPGTEFARDAALKLDLAQDHLAGKEMQVGRYYLKRGHYVAAINRFQEVIRTYNTTSHAPEALHRLVEANLSLGLVEEARAAAAVLGYNYPGSDWYERSYALLTGRGLEPADTDSLSRLWRQVIEGAWL